MCEEAVEVVNEQTEGAPFRISRSAVTKLMNTYAVVTESDPGPKLLQAFECPTKPLIYLQVYYQNGTQVVSIIVRKEDIGFMGPCIDKMCYAIKKVKNIRPTESYSTFKTM